MYDNISVFDTSQGTQNLGDYIIMESINNEMKYLFENNFISRFSTHTPIARWYQNLRKGMVLRVLEKSKYKFIGGTNIFKNTLFRFNPDWNINYFNIRFYNGAIAIGCGSALNAKKMDLYTKILYKRILNKQFIHSTRDERTKKMLEKLGFKAINTGCATLWKLTPEHCACIPKVKSDSVVFTLTDYLVDRNKDILLIDILKKNYKNVYYWIQGAEDYEYYKSLPNIDNVKIIAPNLEAYKEILLKGVDYVGTRLHAGIYAMQYLCRTIIISIDERAKDMDNTYNLKCISRDDIEKELEMRINSSFETKIKIDIDAINQWKSQFK